MLKHLHIQGFTLIDNLDIEINPGFTVITGETGAGKSIILGALALLLGNRADSKTIKNGCDKCVIEATFGLADYNLRELFEEADIDYDEEECIFRREIKQNGKSRSFINDTPVQLSDMKEIGAALIDIHSQHQNLLLMKEDFQLSVVDIIAKNSAKTADYKRLFKEFVASKQQLEQLQEQIATQKTNEDFIRFQYDELSAADLKENEQEELEQEQQQIEHNEEIKSALFAADQLLSSDENGIISSLRAVLQQLNSISCYNKEIEELTARLDSSEIEIRDIARDISHITDNAEFDPARQEWINNRLDLIYSLQKKHHVTSVEDLLQQQEVYKQQLMRLTDSDEVLREAEEKVNILNKQCIALAADITKTRKKAAGDIVADMQQRLTLLDMPSAKFDVVIEEKPLSISGADKATFLFSANKGIALHPISEVASGGEISRVMLSLKAMISKTVKQPTIIFDEIDTGVSGQTAERMAIIMRQMSEAGRQVISITHLPQIAAMGTTHLKVEKEETKTGTESNMRQLTADERVDEIARMLSGSTITQAAIDNARNLLKLQ